MLVAVGISALAMSLALRPAAANAVNIQDGVDSSSVGEMVVTIAPDSFYFRCRGIVSNDGVSTGAGNGGTVTSDVECYWDNPGITINAIWIGSSSCPPNTITTGVIPTVTNLCGDGLAANVTSTPCFWNCAGAAPRTRVGIRPDGRGDLTAQGAGHTFKGTYNQNGAGTSDDTVTMKGCFSTQNTNLGTWYVEVTLNYSATSTASGTMDRYTAQPASCSGSPSGGIHQPLAPVTLTEEEAVTPSTDPNAAVQTSTTNYDGDSCTDVRELGASKGKGGLRDPLNPYDAWDLTRANEAQSVSVDATGGTFKLTFDDTGANPQQTAAISESATAAGVQTALEALSNIAVGDVTVTGAAGGPYTVTFQGATNVLGALRGINLNQMTADSSLLTGGTATATVTTITNGGPDGKATVSDILAVVAKFGRKETDGNAVGTHATGNPNGLTQAGYSALYERGYAGGGTSVNIGQGEGAITVADILAIVAQFGMNCN